MMCYLFFSQARERARARLYASVARAVLVWFGSSVEIECAGGRAWLRESVLAREWGV